MEKYEYAEKLYCVPTCICHRVREDHQKELKEKYEKELMKKELDEKIKEKEIKMKYYADCKEMYEKELVLLKNRLLLIEKQRTELSKENASLKRKRKEDETSSSS